MNKSLKKRSLFTGMFLWLSLAAIILLSIIAGWIYFYHLSADAWSRGVDDMGHGVDEEDLPWIGAVDPKVTVYEFIDYDCPHCPVAHKLLRKVLLAHRSTLRVVRCNYARMPCTNSTCQLVKAGLCAQKQGKFWRWNDYVIQNTAPSLFKEDLRDKYLRDAVEHAGLDASLFKKCQSAADTVDMAQKIYLKARRSGIVGTPGYVVDGKRYSPKELFSFLSEKL